MDNTYFATALISADRVQVAGDDYGLAFSAPILYAIRTGLDAIRIRRDQSNGRQSMKYFFRAGELSGSPIK
jgi:hypothetical protein